MKPTCLMLAARPFCPPMDGGAIRAFNVTRLLAERFDIDLVLFVPPAYPDAGIEELRSVCRSVTTVPFPTGVVASGAALLRSFATRLPVNYAKYDLAPMRRAIARTVLERGPHDVVFVHWLHMMRALGHAGSRPVFVDTQNNDTTLLKRWAANRRNPVERAFGRLQVAFCERYLRRVCPQAGRIVTVSERVAREYEALAPGCRTLVAENGVDTSYYAGRVGEEPQGNTLLFTGDMKWIPNDDAARFYIESIAPLVRAETPDVHCIFAGRRPADDLAGRKDTGIEFTGFVDDMRTQFARAKLFVVPLRIGGGTRLKILEALAMGLPVVSTSVGAEGLELRDGEHLLIRDDPREFATAVRELLGDAERRATLAAAGHARVRERYDWSAVLKSMVDEVAMTAEGGLP